MSQGRLEIGQNKLVSDKFSELYGAGAFPSRAKFCWQLEGDLYSRIRHSKPHLSDSDS